MANNLPQFSPTGGEGSTYQEFIFKNGQWGINPAFILPQQPDAPLNPGIVSTTNYRDALATTESTIDDFSNDPYMKLFADLKLKNQQFEETARLNAEAEANRAKVQQDQNFAGRSAAAVSSNISGGLSRYAPELADSAVQQVYNQNYQKVQDIQAAEDLAIAKAKEARSANDLDVMKEQLGYVQELRKAKAEAISEASKMAFEREKFERNYALDQQREARLGGAGGTEALSLLDLERINKQYSIQLPLGTTQAQAEAIVNDPQAIYDTQISQFKEALRPQIQQYVDAGFDSENKIWRKFKRQYNTDNADDPLDAGDELTIRSIIQELL